MYNMYNKNFGGYIMVDNENDDYENIVREEMKEFYLDKKENEVANELVELYKQRNELDIKIFKKRAEYKEIIEQLHKSNDEMSK